MLISFFRPLVIIWYACGWLVNRAGLFIALAVEFFVASVEIVIAQTVPPDVMAKVETWSPVQLLVTGVGGLSLAVVTLFWVNQRILEEMRKVTIAALEFRNSQEDSIAAMKASTTSQIETQRMVGDQQRMIVDLQRTVSDQTRMIIDLKAQVG